MRRISKMIPKDPPVPELRYLYVDEQGATATNGTIAIKFDVDRIGQLATAYEKLDQPFAIMDAPQFVAIAQSLEGDTVLSPNRDGTQLVAKSQASNLRIQIPITTSLPERLAHQHIDWDPEGAVEVEVGSLFSDFPELITNDGANLWGDQIGVYVFGPYAATYDYGVCLVENAEFGPGEDLLGFVPKALIDLGLAHAERIAFSGSATYVYGDGVSYRTSPAISTAVLETCLGTYDAIQDRAEIYQATVDPVSGVWKRAALFGNTLIMEIRSGVITLKSERWQEEIGTTDAPDHSFNTWLSLVRRWALGTVDHSICDDSPLWYLYGASRSGTHFVGQLTGVNSATAGDDDYDPFEAEEDDEVEALI